jgi:hypothetical protein
MTSLGVPTIHPGMRVEVSPDETFSDVWNGEIVATNGGRPHIAASHFTEDNFFPLHPMRYCLHVNDPELEKQADEIRQDEFRGVYRLAHSEIQAAETVRAIGILENRMDKMAEEAVITENLVDDLRRRVALLEEAAHRLGTIRKKSAATAQ